MQVFHRYIHQTKKSVYFTIIFDILKKNKSPIRPKNIKTIKNPTTMLWDFLSSKCPIHSALLGFRILLRHWVFES